MELADKKTVPLWEKRLRQAEGDQGKAAALRAVGQGAPTPVGTSGYGGQSFLLALATGGEGRVDSVCRAFAHRGFPA